MQDNCRNCLAQEVCDITGGVCQKMDALFAQRKSVTNRRTTMTSSSNSGNKNSATPKDVAAKTEIKDAETVVPAQAAAPAEIKTEVTVEPQDGEVNTDKLTLVQRVKAGVTKVSKNRTAMLLLGGGLVIVGLTYKNNRVKTETVEETIDDSEGTVENPNATDDSN